MQTFRSIAAFAALPLLAAALRAQAVADTQFSVPRGLYTTPFTLTISTATPGATIKYTLDCSDPRTSTLAAQGPNPLTLTIDPASTNGGLRPLTPGVVVRAYAFAPGLQPTNVDTVTYVFPQRVLTQTRPTGFPTQVDFTVDPLVVNNPLYAPRILGDLAALPTMSVVAPHLQMFGSSGVVRAANGSIEVPGSIEVVHPDGRDDQVDCGLTPHSWTQNKRSIRVYFRATYGNDKWRHDLFRNSAEGQGVGISSFDGLVLRAGFNDGILYNEPARAGRYSLCVDELGRSSQLALTGFGPRGLFVHLYLNGLYWGLYNPVERPESSYWSDTFGGHKDDYFARNHGGTVDGNPAWYQGLISGAATWATTSARLDVPSFCDYILYWTYCGGGDWPSFNGANNNWYAGNRVLPTPGRVRFFVWDCEDSWIDLPNRPGPPNDGARIVNELLVGPLDISILWRGLQNVADFRLQWADRVYRQCANDGPLSEANVLQRWNRITKVVDLGTVGESMRWGRFDPRGVTWTRNADWVPYTNQVRQMFVGNQAALLAALRNTALPSAHPALFPSIDPPLFQTGTPATTITVTRARVLAGTSIALARASALGTIWYTTDGSDPRGPTGAAVGQNGGIGVVVPVAGTMVLRARTLNLFDWSALHELQLEVVPTAPLVEIHELLAENVAGLADDAGDHDDWIELCNRGLVDAPLAGYHLSDDPAAPTKWTFPAGTVCKAGGTLLVWADDEPAEGLLHATFRLSGLGESIHLYAPGGSAVVDEFTFGAQRDDESIGRLEHVPGSLVAFARPSPERRNGPQPAGHVRYQALDPAQNPADLRGLGVPVTGDWLRWEMENLPPGGLGVVGVGTAALHTVIPGLGTLLVDPILLLPGIADATGEAKFALALPEQANLRGATFYAQGAAFVGSGLQLSNGVESRIAH
ncbi:MAG: chitobiase/beta-hexosaminidase C-terminal domain-containing protein [Planctomycetes bacterium]|nr:chitobiase/beta-hexosaminidase C-terminal domain-containing protein [Planctomycetota bacterium]